MHTTEKAITLARQEIDLRIRLGCAFTFTEIIEELKAAGFSPAPNEVRRLLHGYVERGQLGISLEVFTITGEPTVEEQVSDAAAEHAETQERAHQELPWTWSPASAGC